MYDPEQQQQHSLSTNKRCNEVPLKNNHKAQFPPSANFFLANASKLEYENSFIFSASYRSTSKEYRLVSARWKPCLIREKYTKNKGTYWQQEYLIVWRF